MIMIRKGKGDVLGGDIRTILSTEHLLGERREHSEATTHGEVDGHGSQSEGEFAGSQGIVHQEGSGLDGTEGKHSILVTVLIRSAVEGEEEEDQEEEEERKSALRPVSYMTTTTTTNSCTYCIYIIIIMLVITTYEPQKRRPAPLARAPRPPTRDWKESELRLAKRDPKLL